MPEIRVKDGPAREERRILSRPAKEPAILNLSVVILGINAKKCWCFVLNSRGGQHDEGAGMRPGRSREEAA